jgi:hypothetical protein
MPSSASIHCFRYEACDIPPGTTIEAWKRKRPGPATRPAGRVRPTLRSLLRRSR